VDERLAGGGTRVDDAALADIYRRYRMPIFRYLSFRLGRSDVAEELTAEVFARVVQAARNGQFAHTGLRPWLYRIAHNLAANYVRDHYRVVEESLCEDVSGSMSTERAAAANLSAENLAKAMAQLTPDQREVLTLRFCDDLSGREVAEITGKPETAVWALQHRALENLRKLLEVPE
jgi:RNA polymerase sigma-70 factor (ECF subfamily)